MLLTINQIINDPEIFEASIDRIISICALDLISRNDMTEIDTVLLRDARQHKELIYDSQVLRNIYKTISDRFEKAFENFKTEDSAFEDYKDILSNFLTSLWTEYLSREIRSLRSLDSHFALYTMKVITQPENGLQLMSQINEILNERYSDRPKK